MDKYKFWQGLLLGICLWGAISIGLRFIHYEFNIAVPKYLMSSGLVLKPILPDEKVAEYMHRLEVAKVLKDQQETTRDKAKEWIGIVANIMTVVAPICSGVMAIVIFRRQRMLLPVPTKGKRAKSRGRR